MFTLLAAELPRYGRSATFVAVDDLDGWERELAGGADVVYVETLSNPMLRVADLPRLAGLAHRAGAIAAEVAVVSLAARDGDLAQLVEWHFFAGLSFEEIAGELGRHERTVRHDWELARSYLRRAMDAQ